MNFSVQWMPDALTQLADIWTNSDDRQAITAASFKLDQRLVSNPLNEGEGRGGTERITFEYPLRILFRVFMPARRVEVHSVGVIPHRDR